MSRLGLALLAALSALPLRADDPARFARWEVAVRAIEERDRQQPPPPGGVLFIGSSSIRLWDLKKSFPDLPAVNHGFGGSRIADSAHFAGRLVTPVKPRLVVFYAGDNDIAAGLTPQRVRDDFRAFVRAVRKELPQAKILFLAIKPSVARWKLVEAQRKANELIEAECKAGDRLQFVDAGTPLLGPDGKPRPELFQKDGLHLNEKGYAIWADALRPLLK